MTALSQNSVRALIDLVENALSGETGMTYPSAMRRIELSRTKRALDELLLKPPKSRHGADSSAGIELR